MLDSNDHRSLAKRLDLLHFEEDAPGMAFWHPAGLALYRVLEDAARRQLRAGGYDEVKTPQILRRPVWEASGHWEHFRHGMFHIAERRAGAARPDGEHDGIESAVKPVSCPGHVMIAKRRVLSYRDLPLRYAELGVVHRDEPGGTLHGLLRLRQFTQDDGHVFCREDQAVAEVQAFCRGALAFYESFGFADLRIALSTRPAARAGEDALWDRAEAALAAALDGIGICPDVQAGEGAFYGPKIELSLRDRQGREWQCGTIQYDLVMPRRFDARYVDASGERVHVVLLHRALYGSLERFLGILLEHHGTELPPWLAPRQARVLPIAAEHEAFARDVSAALASRSVRVDVDARSESVARRIAEAHEDGVAFVAVVGDREVAARTIALRSRDAKETLPFDVAVEAIAARCAPPALRSRP